jgi:DNA helicase HerA-like ATPase
MLDALPIGIKDGTWFHDQDSIFIISPETHRKHVAIFGATGAGKSTLLQNMIAWDIDSGAGVTAVDPHGGLNDKILTDHIPRRRKNDVIVFDPRDRTHVIGINVPDCPRYPPSAPIRWAASFVNNPIFYE